MQTYRVLVARGTLIRVAGSKHEEWRTNSYCSIVFLIEYSLSGKDIQPAFYDDPDDWARGTQKNTMIMVDNGSWKVTYKHKYMVQVQIWWIFMPQKQYPKPVQSDVYKMRQTDNLRISHDADWSRN